MSHILPRSLRSPAPSGLQFMPPLWSGAYVGLPFKENGEGMNGADCGGLVCMVLRQEAGIIVDLRNHVYTPDAPETTATNLASAGGRPPFQTKVLIGVERVFDVVLMKGTITYGGRTYLADCHLGIITAPGWVLHVDRHHPAMQVRLSSLEGRIVFIVRHDSLADLK